MKCEFVVLFIGTVTLLYSCCVHGLPIIVASTDGSELVESAIEQNVGVPDQISEAQQFYEVDAFGDDFIDFGAQTGPLGAYQWHANYPIHRSANYGDDDSEEY